jgi:hypothetical protein
MLVAIHLKNCLSNDPVERSNPLNFNERTSGLTVKQASDIERVQKVAVNIILSDCFTGNSVYNYDMALVVLDIEPLKDRREKLCFTFAKKTLKSRHSDMFPLKGNEHNTRNKTNFFENRTNTRGYFILYSFKKTKFGQNFLKFATCIKNAFSGLTCTGLT